MVFDSPFGVHGVEGRKGFDPRRKTEKAPSDRVVVTKSANRNKLVSCYHAPANSFVCVQKLD